MTKELTKAQVKTMDTHFRKIARKVKSRPALKNVELFGSKARMTDGVQLLEVTNYPVEIERERYWNPLTDMLDENLNYPNLDKVKPPQVDQSLTVNTKKLEEAIDLILAKIAEQKEVAVVRQTNSIRLHLDKENQDLKVSAFSPIVREIEVGSFKEQTITEDLKIHFDPKRLKEVVMFFRQMKAKEIVLEFMNNPYRPLVLRADNIYYILTPMRVNPGN